MSITKQETIDTVLRQLGLTEDQVGHDNIIDFIDFNGINDLNFVAWEVIPELWNDWSYK